MHTCTYIYVNFDQANRIWSGCKRIPQPVQSSPQQNRWPAYRIKPNDQTFVFFFCAPFPNTAIVAIGIFAMTGIFQVAKWICWICYLTDRTGSLSNMACGIPNSSRSFLSFSSKLQRMPKVIFKEELFLEFLEFLNFQWVNQAKSA